jgi:hypothetical protein
MQAMTTVTPPKSGLAKRQTKAIAARTSQEPPPSWWVHGLVLLALLAVCLAFYARTFGLGFLSLDDPDYIQKNPFLAPFIAASLWHILSTPYFANYAPAHLLTYALDVALAGGKSAWAMHVSNVLWYTGVVWMVYVLGLAINRNQPIADTGGALKFAGGAQHPKSISGRPEPQAKSISGRNYWAIGMAAGAALLFSAHPAHVEVVAWLSSRKDLVATAFAALSMACYVRSRRGGSSGWWYAGSVLSFLLASSGKQSVVLLPLVMLAWEVLVDHRRDWKMLLGKIPFGVIALFFAWMTWGAQPSTRQSSDPFVLAMTQWSNLWLLTGLGQYVLYRPRPNPAEIAGLLKVAIIVGAVLVWAAPLLLARCRQNIRALLCCWVLVQMLPPMALSFLTPITDRYLFLSSVGVCLLLPPLLVPGIPGPRKWNPILGTLGLALILAAWSWKTWSYVGEWRDPRSVWHFAAAKCPSPQAFEYGGEVYHEAADRVAEFIKSGKFPTQTNDLSLARAVLNNPPQLEALRAEWSNASLAWTNSLAYRDRLWSLAWEQYEQAVAHRGTLNNPTLFMRRGMILINRSRYQEAIKEFTIGLELAQTHTYEKARQELGTGLERAIGVAYWGMGKYPEAKDWLLQAQATQRQSGLVWVPTLDQEVERITSLARTPQ